MRISRFLLTLILVAMAGVANAADLILSEASVVIVYEPKSSKHETSAEAQNESEARSDFVYHIENFKKAVRAQRAFKLIQSTAETIRFANHEHENVTRTSLSGFGVIMFKPHTAPIIISGVATDADLICEAVQLFSIHVEGYGCET